MKIFDALIAVCWLSFLACWLISARGVKGNRQGVSWSREAGIRIVVGIAVLLLVASPLRHYVASAASFHSNTALGSIGAVLCALGVAFAIWARVYLGKNWGMPMTLKAEPELVSNGPYGFVRHPIYTGIITAMAGSVLVVGTNWLVVVVILGPYFLCSAATEEALMAKEFPGQYPDYKRRTKMFIPFIF